MTLASSGAMFAGSKTACRKLARNAKILALILKALAVNELKQKSVSFTQIQRLQGLTATHRLPNNYITDTKIFTKGRSKLLLVLKA
jgi:hypothetical protein